MFMSLSLGHAGASGSAAKERRARLLRNSAATGKGAPPLAHFAACPAFPCQVGMPLPLTGHIMGDGVQHFLTDIPLSWCTNHGSTSSPCRIAHLDHGRLAGHRPLPG